jgi:homoserine O-acetyltransferase
MASRHALNSRQHGVAFPQFTTEDMTRAQYRVLTEMLHVKHVWAAVGLSLGGHQVFAWSVLYPEFVSRAVPIVGSPQATNFDRLSKQIVIDAIESDPDYKGGDYTKQPPLKLANAIGVQMLTTPAFRNAEAPRDKYAEWLAKVELRSGRMQMISFGRRGRFLLGTCCMASPWNRWHGVCR